MNNQDLLKQFFDDLSKSFTSRMYSYLIHYTPDYQYKSLKPYHKELEDRLSSKTCIKYWGGQNNDYFINFRSKHPFYNKNYVKIYVPLNGNNVTDIVTKIFIYIADNNIDHSSKLASETRTDDLVIRVTNMQDAKKVIDFINNDPEICEGLYKSTLPFDVNCGNVSVAYDERKAFHIDLASYIDGYIKSTTEPLSLEGFKSYLEQLYSKKYAAVSEQYDGYSADTGARTKFDFADAKSFNYNFKEYQLNTLKILLLIMRNIEGENTLEDFEEYYNMINDPLYKNNMEDLVRNMYIKTQQGDFYKAEFGIFDNFTNCIYCLYNKDLSFYKGRVDGCVDISCPDVDTTSLNSFDKINIDDTLDDTLDGTLEYNFDCFITGSRSLNSLSVSETKFFMANGMDDLDAKNKIEQQQELELSSLKEWLQTQVKENLDLINKYYALKFDTCLEFVLDDNGNVLRRKPNCNSESTEELADYEKYLDAGNINSYFYGPDYYLGYLSKLLELETKNLTPLQMSAVIQQKEKCKNALHGFRTSYILHSSINCDEVERRYEELGITKDTDLEELAISLADKYKTFQRKL